MGEFKRRSKINYKVVKANYEKPCGKSVTVPGEGYTVQQLFKRHKAGLLGDLGKNASYVGGDHDSEDLEKLPHKDLVEIDEFLEAEAHKSASLREDAKQKYAKHKKDVDEKQALQNELEADYKKRKSAAESADAHLEKEPATTRKKS